MRSPDGRLYQVAPDQVEQLSRDQGYVVATPEEVEARTEEREKYSKYGSTGQQALGLVEAAVRNATFGLVSGISGTEEEQRDRANVVSEESPILNTAAQVAPSVALSLVLPETIGFGAGSSALSAIAGGMRGGGAAVGLAADEAFKRDEELSSEAALSNFFGPGMLIGAGANLGVSAAGRLITRNRLIEASGKAARKAEQEAFHASGVVQPVAGLAEAVDDPVKAAALRQAAKNARPSAQETLERELGVMETADLAAQQSTAARALDDAFPGPSASSEFSDIAAQRAATRNVIHGARTELEAIAPPQVKGRVERMMEMLDASDSPTQILGTATALRRTLDELLDSADSAPVAKVLQKYATQARELEGSANIFGAAGESTAKRTAQLDALADARIALKGQLEAGPYLGQIGTAGAKPIDEALDTYMSRLDDVLRGSDDEVAKKGLEAIARLRTARETIFQEVAGGNQADALKQFASAGGRQSSNPMRDILGEVAETAVESMIPGAGLVRKAWKYRKHILRLAGVSRKQAGVAADRLLNTALTTVGKGSRALTAAAVPLGARQLYLQDIDNNPEQAYNKIKNIINTLHTEPEKLADALASQMGDMADEAPELLGLMNQKAARIVDFLQSKIPPSFEYSLLYPDGPPPSRTDILQMSLYWNGITKPEEVLKAIGDGSAMPEEVEAFRVANPAWFDELQEAIQERIVVKNKSGEVIPAYRISQLETLLDLPGKLDPTFGPSVARITEQAREMNQQQARTPSYVPVARAGERIKTNQEI